MSRDRAIVDKLIDAINRKFEANSHKGTWHNLKDSYILRLLAAEVDELVEAKDNRDYDNAIDEAADVALFAAFYADPERT